MFFHDLLMACYLPAYKYGMQIESPQVRSGLRSAAYTKLFYF